MAIDMTKLAAKAKAQKEASMAQTAAPAATGHVIGANGKPVPQFYANIGVTVDMPNDEGAEEPQFFSSNIGAPVDFLERLSAGENSSDEWKMQVMMQNAFVDRIEATSSELGVGETTILEVPLTVAIQLRRTNPNKVSPDAKVMNPAVAAALAAMKT
jgi:hypothetical protein